MESADAGQGWREAKGQCWMLQTGHIRRNRTHPWVTPSGAAPKHEWKEAASGAWNSRAGGMALLPQRNFICRGRRAQVDEVETRISGTARNNW